jgi:hypothetical protein
MMPRSRRLRLLVLEGGLALRTGALRLWVARTAGQLDEAYRSIVAEMPGYREIVNSADGGFICHCLR